MRWYFLKWIFIVTGTCMFSSCTNFTISKEHLLWNVFWKNCSLISACDLSFYSHYVLNKKKLNNNNNTKTQNIFTSTLSSGAHHVQWTLDGGAFYYDLKYLYVLNLVFLQTSFWWHNIIVTFIHLKKIKQYLWTFIHKSF